jgi:sec-independent protein translocase protein TatB
MFDFGFTELMLVAVVALIVVGPERLPKVARTAGHMLGRLQRYVSDVKSDISREMQLEDLKKLQQQVEEQARDLESSMRKQMNEVESDFGKTAAKVRDDVSLDAARPHVGVSDAQPALSGHAPVSEAQRTPVDSPIRAAATERHASDDPGVHAPDADVSAAAPVAPTQPGVHDRAIDARAPAEKS